MAAVIDARIALDGKSPDSYWADAAACRLAQLSEIHAHDTTPTPMTLHSAEACIASLTSTIDEVALQLVEEEEALRIALRTLRGHFERRQAAIFAAIRDANAQRNALLPIARLPLEVLEEIFMVLCAKDPPNAAYLRWIPSATHVCRTWRRVALACPRLWAMLFIPLRGRRMTDTVLARTGSRLLDVTVTVHYPYKTLDLVRQNLFRTRSLRLSCMDSEYFHKLDLPCPVLQRLDIRGTGMIPTRSSPKILNGIAPCLRELRFVVNRHQDFYWSAQGLTSLVTLEVLYDRKVNHLGRPRGQRARLEDVVEALRRMVCLENLTIQTPSFARASRTEPVPDIVQLPRLSYVSLGAPLADAQRFFERVLIPATAALHVQTPEVPQADTKTLPTFFSTLRPFLHSSGPDSLPITKLSISGSVPWSARISDSLPVIHVSAWRGASRTYHPPILLTFERQLQQHTTRDVVSTFASRHLRELVMLDPDWGEDSWKTALEHAPCLERIYAAGRAAVALCAVIGSSANAILKIGLASLELRDVDFDQPVSPQVPGTSEDNADDAGPRVGAVLPGWLASTAHPGHWSLQTLDIRRCTGMSRNDISLLRAALPDTGILEPRADPGGSRSLHWGSSVKSDSADRRVRDGRRGGTLLICASPPAGAEGALVVLGELEVNDGDDVPPDKEILALFK